MNTRSGCDEWAATYTEPKRGQFTLQKANCDHLALRGPGWKRVYKISGSRRWSAESQPLDDWATK